MWVEAEEQMTTFTKAVMADKLNKLGFSKQEAKEMVEYFFEEILLSLRNGEHVKLSGFGNFQLRDKRERLGRNPKTKEEAVIPAKRVVTFKPGQKLKARVESYVEDEET